MVTFHEEYSAIQGFFKWSWKLFINGYVDEVADDNGAVDRRLPFAELKTRSHINEQARAAGAAPDFSTRL